MPLTEQERLERDSKRDIGMELLQAAQQINAGLGKAAYRIKVPETTTLSGMRVSYCKSTDSLYLHLADRVSVDF